jgi:hypothetical protein
MKNQKHSLAFRLRMYDAEVSFKPWIFLEEFVLQFLGYVAYPVILYRMGCIGARNRVFDWDVSQGQFQLSVLFTLCNVLYWIFSQSEVFSVTLTEYVLINLLFASRAAVVAGMELV